MYQLTNVYGCHVSIIEVGGHKHTKLALVTIISKDTTSHKKILKCISFVQTFDQAILLLLVPHRAQICRARRTLVILGIKTALSCKLWEFKDIKDQRAKFQRSWRQSNCEA